MEYTREIYWNVGSGADVLVPMYALALCAIAVLAWGFWKRIEVYRMGRSLDRLDNLGARLASVVKNALFQNKVLNFSFSGIAHALFFWGMFLLFIGTCLVLVQVDITDPLFGVRFLQGRFYQFFSLVLDVAGLVAVVLLCGLFIRRYLVRPEGVISDRDDLIMHGLLFMILITGFLVEGARMAVTELGTSLAEWSPVGHLVAKVMSGLDDAVLQQLHGVLWWLHLVISSVLIMLIPFTRLRHMFTSSLNFLFEPHGPKGLVPTLAMDAEDIESFGAAWVSDMSWKDLLDTDACTRCKRCQDQCPAYLTDKPLSPMTIINQIGEVAFSAPETSLVEACNEDALWSCTTCLACQESCPTGIEHVNKIIDMRRNLMLMEGVFPGPEVMTAVEQVEVNGNPLGLGYASRGDWADGLPVVRLEDDPGVDLLYFVGCYASFDRRNIAVARSFTTICAAAGVKVGILGRQEKCCGAPVRKLGNEYLYQTIARENIAKITSYGIDKVVTTCPHCFNTLNKDYRDLGFEADVEHSATFLERLVRRREIKLRPLALDCTYHDSCYLGRYNDFYDAPRDLLAVAGGRVVEMDRHFDRSFCCGAGGGRILAEENIGERISRRRVRMAMETGQSTLISNCPFCLSMFDDAIKGEGLEERLQVRDLNEVIAERLC